MKKEWQEPKLIVLMRGRTEENVLSSCKTAGSGAAGPGISRPRCEILGAACFALGAS
jgi:hypothetical protein